MPEILLVLMDLQLPKLNGYDATIAIRKFKPQLPIIAQTAFALSGESEKSILAGCNDYISKPIDVQLLFTILHKYIA